MGQRKPVFLVKYIRIYAQIKVYRCSWENKKDYDLFLQSGFCCKQKLDPLSLIFHLHIHSKSLRLKACLQFGLYL